MVKKTILLSILILCFIFIQNTTFAQEQYAQNFYINSIQKKIERNWMLPLEATGKSAVLSFTVNTDGSVSNVNILRSSGDYKFDKSVVASVYKPVLFESPIKIDEPINIQFFFSPIFTSATIINNQNQSNIVNIANKSPYINFSDYTDNLQNKINSNWNPKTLAKEKSAMASIKISKDGSLNDFYIIKSSRNKKFDRDIMDSIAKSVPMDAFPDEINAPSTDVQLTFNYNRSKLDDNTTVVYNHYISANVMNIKGYDKYTKQAEKILADNFKDKRCFFYKDLVVELDINKVGKLKYVKIVKPSKDKNFDRKMLAILQKTSFPPIPETIPFNDVILNYEIITQRGRSFHDFIFDYLLYSGTTGLKSFSLSKEQ